MFNPLDLILLHKAKKGGNKPTGTISITENGEVDVTNYAIADVNVPQPSGTTAITINGTHNVKDFEYAIVSVSPTGTKNITSNGTHDVGSYKYANVNVTPLEWRSDVTITNNASSMITVWYATQLLSVVSAMGSDYHENWYMKAIGTGSSVTIPMARRILYDSSYEDRSWDAITFKVDVNVGVNLAFSLGKAAKVDNTYLVYFTSSAGGDYPGKDSSRGHYSITVTDAT